MKMVTVHNIKEGGWLASGLVYYLLLLTLIPYAWSDALPLQDLMTSTVVKARILLTITTSSGDGILTTEFQGYSNSQCGDGTPFPAFTYITKQLPFTVDYWNGSPHPYALGTGNHLILPNTIAAAICPLGSVAGPGASVRLLSMTVVSQKHCSISSNCLTGTCDGSYTGLTSVTGTLDVTC
jgi:hypothetical protein